MSLRARTPWSVLNTLFLSTALAVAVPAQGNNDTVTFKDGKSDSGRIKSEDFSGIVLDAKGGDRTIPWADIAPQGIAYGGSPEFQLAKEQYEGRRYEEALPNLLALKADTKLRAPLKQNVLYFLPHAQQMSNDVDAALAGYAELLKEFPTSRWLAEVSENVVQIHVDKKDLAGAIKALDKIGADALSAGVDQSFNAAVGVQKGHIFAEQGKWAEARAAFGVAGKAAGAPLRFTQAAQLGEARAAIQLNARPDAERIYRALTEQKDASNAVFAGAWNGLADLTLDDARKANSGKGDADKILDALYMYMRGVVQYGPLPGESTGEHERSLAGAAKTFKFLGELESNAERKRNLLDRSNLHKAMLARDFPNSAWLRGL